ncbi:MAG: PAS domain S-box protein [Bacteroidetes bacterium]|nr:PAS domain S-box protein [Bacteroidota bacterium]MBS1628868.1 PAS domain S-box protein [Bacteroidota bacterium]
MNRLSQEEFVALFDQAALGIVTVNPQGLIVRVNNFALLQFGYEAEDVVGCKIEKLIPMRYRERHETHRNDFTGENPHQRPMGMGMDLWALRKDGTEFPVEVSLSSYTTNEGIFSIAFISDITVRKAHEDALRQMNDELEKQVDSRTRSLREALEREKELGELKSRFVSMASHEFRTPLSTILSSAYLISKYDKGEDQSKRDKHVQRIVSSVNVLTDILNDFLSVGRIEEGKIQVRKIPLELQNWMNELLAELQQLLKPQQKLEYVHEGDASICLDPSLLRHIVQNLVSNAIKFSPEGATIEIRSKHSQDLLSIAISDRGIGISEEDQKHLFERFFRGANAINIQGTGLGLHIVGRYAELLNGHVSCASRLNEGTTITVTFDLA